MIGYLDDGRDELLQEVVVEELGPVVLDEVDEETLDVGSVLVLICHDHQLAVSQRPQGLGSLVLLLVLQSKNLDDVVDLSIFHDLQEENKE